MWWQRVLEAIVLASRPTDCVLDCGFGLESCGLDSISAWWTAAAVVDYLVYLGSSVKYGVNCSLWVM